jgi:hypothetical protein
VGGVGKPVGQPNRDALTQPVMDSSLARLPPRSVAIVQGFGRPLNRAILIGGVATVVVVTVLVAVGVLELLGWVIGLFVMAAVAALAGVVVAILVLPARIRRAFEAYSWQGHAEVERFKERTGGPVPTKVEAMEQWLAANPATPAMRLPRIEILAFLGRFSEAKDELDVATAANPEADPETAFEIASLRQYIDWLELGSTDLIALRAAVAALPSGTEQQSGAVTLAISEARIRLVERDPNWTAPLEAVRPSLGSVPWRVTIADTWRQIFVLFGIVGLITAMVVPLLRSTL